jgi:hypothetical protein
MCRSVLAPLTGKWHGLFMPPLKPCCSKVYDGIRKGLLPPTQRLIVALAGISYKELAVTMASEPGKASTWANVREWTKQTPRQNALKPSWEATRTDG